MTEDVKDKVDNDNKKIEDEGKKTEDKKIIDESQISGEPPAPPEPQIDPAIVESIQTEVERLKSESKKDKEVINKIKSAFGAEEEEKWDNEEFFKEFANNPQKALDRYYQKRSKNEKKELEELKRQLKEDRLKNEDSRQLAQIKEKDKDFDTVMSNMSKVMTQEEFNSLYKSLEENPLRNEIIYNTVKARVMQTVKTKKEIEEEAEDKAKETINKTAKTLQPTGSSIETKTSEDEARDRINKYKENFDVDKVLDEVFDGDYAQIFKKKFGE